MTVGWTPHKSACDDAAVTSWPLGKLIASARLAAGIRSARAAARLAGFDEATWRNLESGTRKVAAGVEVPYNPSPATLVTACRVIGLDPEPAFAILGWDFDPDEWPANETPAVEERLTAVEEILRRQAEAMARIEDHLGLGPP